MKSFDIQKIVEERYSWIAFGLIIVDLFLRCAIAVRPLPYLDQLTIPDDAYISLKIARNIAQGLGPWYGAGVMNGFQPLYVFIMVPVFWIIPADLITPVHIALIISTIFDGAALFLLMRLALRITQSPVASLAAAAAWVFNPYLIRATLNGMETMLSIFCIILALSYFYSRLYTDGKRRPDHALIFGGLLGLAALARIDTVLLAVVLCVFLIVQDRTNRIPMARSLTTLVLIGAGVFVVDLPWVVYSLYYTGTLVPLSGKAVRFMSLAAVGQNPTWDSFYLPSLTKGVTVLWITQSLLLIETGLLVLLQFELLRDGSSTRREGFARTLWPVLSFCLVLFIAYTGYIFGSWFFFRYFTPIVLAPLLAIALLSSRALRHIQSVSNRNLLCAILLLGPITGNLMKPDIQYMLTSTDTTMNGYGYMNIGLWAERTFPSGTTIGSSQSGALSYFAPNLNVINLDGVINAACYESLVEHRNMEYIKEASIQYIVGWPLNVDFIRNHSTQFREGDLQLKGEIPGFRSWGQPWVLYGVGGARRPL